MNKNAWKKFGITALCLIGGIYILFLVLPLIFNPIIGKYSPQISTEIKNLTGLNARLEGVKIVTTPKLTVGLRIKTFELLTPKNENILCTDDFQVKMSLLPLIVGKIEIDVVQFENANINLRVNDDGTFEFLNFLPENEKETKNSSMPANFPLTLSNHLPNIKINGYTICITDGVDKYILSGDKTEVTDFILDKSIKLKAKGKAVFKDKEQFNYDIKVFNKIMPELDLNELVFNPQRDEEDTVQEFNPSDIIGILNGIYKNNVTANLLADIKTENHNIRGNIDLTNLSIVNLPPSSVGLKFRGDKIDINSNIYTAKNEVSKISGFVKHGKKTNIDLNVKSEVELANILKIVKEVAFIFNIKDLQTLTANGKLDANFSIKSNLKTINSNGYFKIPNANVYYGLYNIGIDKINADVVLDNNNVNIKNIGFTILNQPLKFYGTIREEADLHLAADRLSLKGLLAALGQAALLKENQVNSGTVSINADIKGKLDKINPTVKVNVDNVDIKNLPSNTVLKAPMSIASIISDGKTFSGNAKSANIQVINPAFTLSVPSISANITPEVIEITQTPISIDKINTTVSGKVKNYLTEIIDLNFISLGDIKSKLAGNINVKNQTLNLNYATTEHSEIIIPMFDKSKMMFSGNIAISGSMLNPILKGSISVPSINIPEIPVSMTNLDAKLNGHILKGSGSVQKFTSGGIEAQNLISDFELKGNDFYLNNLSGTAFDGKIKGNIVYNIMNAKTSIDFSGSGLNAEKAVLGATGIKNALSGTLGFDTKMTLKVLDYNDMIKSIKGNLKFNVKNGAFGTIGKIDSFFRASNIVNNVLLKNTVSTIANSAGLAETAKFDYIDGSMTFDNGWAILNPIKSSGSSLAYYVTGKVNLINFSTNVNVLGRLDAPIVAKLGVVGQLSTDKLLSYIPVFGSKTANIVKALTADPKNEKIELIPQLTNGSTNIKDFEVVFNGGLESTSSVKSFKWLTNVDTSAIETPTVKDTINAIKSSVGADVTNTVKNVKDTITTQKEDFNATKEQLKNSVDEIKNLFKSF